jgi:hypothetical protein
MRLLLAVMLLLSATESAAACRKFSVWKYPWPQRCPIVHGIAHAPRPLPPQRDGDIAIPALDWSGGGEADADTRARLMLHAALRQAQEETSQ